MTTYGCTTHQPETKPITHVLLELTADICTDLTLKIVEVGLCVLHFNTAQIEAPNPPLDFPPNQLSQQPTRCSHRLQRLWLGEEEEERRKNSEGAVGNEKVRLSLQAF